MGKIMHGGQAYSGGGGTTVIANPSGTSSADLNKVSIEGVIYNIPSGGGGASTLAGLTDVDLETTPPTDGQVLMYDDTNDKWVNGTVSSGTTVVANPQETATATLTKLKVGDTVYELPSGGGNGGASEKITIVKAIVDRPTENVTIEEQ